MMQWILSPSELNKLRNLSGGGYIKSSALSLEKTNIKWHLIIYPKGYNSNTSSKYMQIFLYSNSIQHSSVNYEIKCQFDTFQTKWKSSTNHTTGKFNQHLQPFYKSVNSACSTAKFIKFELNITISPLHRPNNYEINYSDSDNESEHKITNEVNDRKVNTIHTENNYKNSRHNTYKMNNNHDMVYKWRIPEKIMPSFVSIPQGSSWHSPPFYIHGNKFTLHIYPNGTKSNYNGSIALYLTLEEFEPITTALTIIYEIKVFECNVNACGCLMFGSPTDYNRYARDPYKNSMPLWSPYTFCIHQMKSLKTITFIICFDVMRVSYISNHKENYDMGYIEFDRPIKWKMKNKIDYKWDIVLSEEWYNAINRKVFYSPKFNQWCLRMFPNGYDYSDKGQLNVSLRLVALPPSVWFVIVNLCIKCVQLNVVLERERVKFTIGELRYNLMEFKKIKTLRLRSMSKMVIECNIHIVGFYDKKWNEIIFECNQCNDVNDVGSGALNDINERLKELERTVKEQNVIIKELNEIRSRYEKKSNKERFKVVNNAGEVMKWLNDVVKLPQYVNVFIENGFYDLNDVKLIEMNDLNEMGIDKLAHKLRILRQINVLK